MSGIQSRRSTIDPLPPIDSLVDVEDADAARDLATSPVDAGRARTSGHRSLAAQRAIGMAAAGSIDNGAIIAIGDGPLTTALGRVIVGLSGLTVVTNSLAVCAAIGRAPHLQVIVAAGLLRQHTNSVVGPLAEKALSGLHVSTVYLSGDALTATHGLCVGDVLVAGVDRQLVAAADRVVVLIEPEKIGRYALAQTASGRLINCIITDRSADPVEVGRLRRSGIAVELVSCSGG